MVEITCNEKGGFETTWNIEVKDGDQCSICHKDFANGEMAYCCEVCKTVFHKWCAYPHSFPCRHIKDEYQYFCGHIVIK